MLFLNAFPAIIQNVAVGSCYFVGQAKCPEHNFDYDQDKQQYAGSIKG